MESTTIELHEDQLKYLQDMVEKHSLPDLSKAVRILINFATQDGDEDAIFEEVRCVHC